MPSPLVNLGAWYSTLASNGFTAVGDLGFISSLRAPMQTLAELPGCPVRYSLYQTTYDPGAHSSLDFGELSPMIRRVGCKIWMDGSPSIGTAAISVPLPGLRSRPHRRRPGRHRPGLSVLNYSLDQFLSLVGQFADSGTQIATHINGDAGIDVVLTATNRSWAAWVWLVATTAGGSSTSLPPSREQCARAGVWASPPRCRLSIAVLGICTTGSSSNRPTARAGSPTATPTTAVCAPRSTTTAICRRRCRGSTFRTPSPGGAPQAPCMHPSRLCR